MRAASFLPRSLRSSLALALALACVPVARAAWLPAGNLVATQATLRTLVPDDAGGALVVWSPTSGDSVRLLRVDALGEVAAGWPAAGRAVSNRRFLGAVKDGHGGAYLLFSKTFLVLEGYEYRKRSAYNAWRYDSGGTPAANWPDTGRFVFTDYNVAPLAPVGAWPDDADGAWIVWSRDVYAGDGGTVMYHDFPSVHLRANGTYAAAHTGESEYMDEGNVGRDGLGGVLAIWQSWGTIRLTRWSPADVKATRDLFYSGFNRVELGVCPLPPGGDVLVWWRLTTYPPPDTNTYRLLRIDSSLAPVAGWPADGVACTRVPLMGDGEGGAFMVVDDGGGPRLQRLTIDTPTPVSLWPEGDWPAYAAGLNELDGSAGLFHLWVEPNGGPSVYRMKAIHWTNAAGLAPGWVAGGAEIAPAATTPYQLAASAPDQAIVAWTGTAADANKIFLQLLADDSSVSVEPPNVGRGPAAFALRGFVANPSAGRAVLEFSLPDAAPARLEAYDVTGRVLARRDVGALGAGTHRLELPELLALRPGLVFARLTRAGQSRVARGTLLR